MKKVYIEPKNIIEFSTLESKCVYIPNERMKMRYKYIKDCSFTFNSSLIKRGWRRFGQYFSRPACDNCNKCLSLKLDVNSFIFSKSAKRAIKKNKDTKVIIQKPSVSYEHLRLYEKFHKYMEQKKGWKYYPVTTDSYYELYVKGYMEFGKEVLYIRDNKLIGIDLIDFIDDGISAIYFFYDPEYENLSLGRFSIYKEIEFAKERNLLWIYLGYYVEHCNSLNYKALYKPHKILQGNPHIGETPIWV